MSSPSIWKLHFTSSLQLSDTFQHHRWYLKHFYPNLYKQINSCGRQEQLLDCLASKQWTLSVLQIATGLI